MIARAVHEWSKRRAQPLVALSCSAIPEALQGRELFGCAEGVYPAVPGEYSGALERAGNTTLLLEEISALQSEVCAELLAGIAAGEWQREGDPRARSLEARVILSGSSAASPFGAGQPHYEIQIPALAERPEDVLPLAAHYLRAFAEDAGVLPVGFTADARACLESELWPGDVQELRQRVRQAVLLAGDGAVSAEALLLAKGAEQVPSFKEAKRAFETRYVVGLLRRCSGNISRAARLAKKDRKDFYDVIRRTGVDPSHFRH